ncbi:hypothetical protein GRF29_19g148793 [Pseudopithomyces chartarum]|uniref:Uncharacterized protein n=1 Tax=Pseudopithomyces chartarum TaxID=1892770 RepID=A0AAN6M234_9PLEO|nr:hypothetical protein GRF29_19g148793 [Pseudopithomyces chartarum]
MPPITPTRALIVLTTFLFICLLWTGAFPHEYTPPTPPSVNSDAPNKEPVAAPVLPEPLVDNAGVKPGTPVLEKQNAQSSAPKDVGPELDCKHVRGADQIMIIVQTSKSETSDTLPSHLKSLLSCTPHVLIFSDHTSAMDGFPIHDALSDIPSTTQASHDEFHIYANLSDASYKPPPEKAALLDKWKILPTLYKTATMAPSHRFYLFITPHTSLTWTNLLQWTARLDYRIPYYIGAPHPVATRKYARTAPAILLSYGTLQLYRSTYEDRHPIRSIQPLRLPSCLPRQRRMHPVETPRGRVPHWEDAAPWGEGDGRQEVDEWMDA